MREYNERKVGFVLYTYVRTHIAALVLFAINVVMVVNLKLYKCAISVKEA